MSFPQALLISLLGICTVFLALALLMAVIKLTTTVTDGLEARREKRKTPETPAAVPSPPVAAAATPEPAPAEAPGSAGEIRLHGVEPRIAAMLMAIVADELDTPVNQLRFRSIREIKEEEP